MNSFSPAAYKVHCNRAHARRRAFERFDINLTDEDFDRIEGRIRLGSPHPDCVPVRVDRAAMIYAVRHDDVWLPVVYELSTRTVVTVLDANRLDLYWAKLDPIAVPASASEEETQQPAAVATPARPKFEGSPAGTVVGYIPLPDVFDAVMATLPPEPPPLGESPTVAEIDKTSKALNVRLRAIQWGLKDKKGMLRCHPGLVRLKDEVGRIEERKREIKRMQESISEVGS